MSEDTGLGLVQQYLAACPDVSEFTPGDLARWLESVEGPLPTGNELVLAARITSAVRREIARGTVKRITRPFFPIKFQVCGDTSREAGRMMYAPCFYCGASVRAFHSLLFGTIFYSRDGEEHYCEGMSAEDASRYW